jgi:hypothetical protein
LGTIRHIRGRRSRLRWRTIGKWLWYRELDPVSPGECLLRAIPNTADYFKSSMGRWSVDPYAFTPSKKRDPDGLSFYREDFASPKTVARECQHPASARVARIKVAELRALGLTVTPSLDRLAGHVIVQEMNYGASKDPATKQKVKSLTIALSQLASKNIAFAPPEMEWPERQKKT